MVLRVSYWPKHTALTNNKWPPRIEPWWPQFCALKYFLNTIKLSFHFGTKSRLLEGHSSRLNKKRTNKTKAKA
jgi:hypothetical protein